MLDPQDEAYDRRLAHHLVALYYQSEEQIEEEFLDMAVLKDYIAYARTYINPRLNEEASQALIEVRYHLNKMLQVKSGCDVDVTSGPDISTMPPDKCWGGKSIEWLASKQMSSIHWLLEENIWFWPRVVWKCWFQV